MSLELGMVVSYTMMMIKLRSHLHRNYNIGLVPELSHGWIEHNVLWQPYVQDIPVIG